MTNLKGFKKYGDSWKSIDEINLHAFIGLPVLQEAAGFPVAVVVSLSARLVGLS